MSVELTIQLDEETKQKLDELAERSHQTASQLANQALVAYLQTEAWEEEQILQAMQEADAGLLIPHEKVAAWMRSWGKPDELPCPEPE